MFYSLGWEDVAHRVDHLLANDDVIFVVVDDVSTVRHKVLAKEDVGQAKVKDEDAKVQELAENKLGKVLVRLVLDNFEVLDIVADGFLQVFLVRQDESRLGL